MSTELPRLIADYVEATNDHDGDALQAAFAEGALVNDIRREFWGLDAIRRWADREIIGVKVTMKVTTVVEHFGDFVVSAEVDGDFDKTDLPDPLVLTFYFSVHQDRISRLIIVHNTSSEN